MRKLEKERTFKGQIDLEEISWDDPDQAHPLDAHLTPQEAINRSLAAPSACDIVVVVFWSRMGTPLPREYAKADGSTYRSGTEYEFLDAIASAEKTGRPSVWVYRRDEELKVGSKDPGRDEILRQADTVEAFFSEFQDETGAIRRTYFRYPSPSQFQKLFEDHLRDRISELLQERSPPSVSRPAAAAAPGPEVSVQAEVWKGNPYRGLDPFRPEDTAIFFGRGLETDELVKRIRDGVRVLPVIGASGSGKSSLVAAGLLPRLTNGAVDGSSDWIYARFTPAEQGENPFRALAMALFPHLSEEDQSGDGLAERLMNAPGDLEQVATRVLASKPPSAQLLLFADQFEELFTARVAEAHRAPFVTLVEAIAVSRRVRLVLTLRADYYEHCTRFEGLAARLSDRPFSLAAPSGRALIELIERPARAAGAVLEAGLLEDILNDLGGEAGSLALLEFTLEKLYDKRRDEHRRGGILCREAYRQLKGVGGAIDIQGEKAVLGPAGQVDEAALWGVFDALSEVDESGGAVKQRAWLEDFSEREQGLVQSLIQARLATADKDDTGRAWVQVAHEAVLRSWGRFSRWLDKHRDFKLWRKQLKTWMDSQELLRGVPLGKALEMVRIWRDKLTEPERAYIGESAAAARRRQVLIRGGSGLIFGLVTVFGVVNYLAAEAERERRRPIYRAEDWVHIEPGEFCMGSRGQADAPGECELPVDPEAQDAEKPAHRVKITKPFLLARYEVTFEEYDRYVYDNLDKGLRLPSDSGFGAGLTPEQRNRLPVINVSWQDAQGYIAWLSAKLGKRFRLPTEAEWEYAARAGTTALRFWGLRLEDACTYANGFDRAHEREGQQRFGIDWEAFPCDDDPYLTAAPVGSYKPNPGFNRDDPRDDLYDMLGNVNEWVEDCAQRYEHTPQDGSAYQLPEGQECGRRVIRGGSWYYLPNWLRSAYRFWYTPGDRNYYLGFRLAQDL